MRRAAFALLVLASGLIVVLWAAGVDWRAPFSPAERRAFAGSDFTAVFGAGSAEANRLRVESASADSTTLQSLRPDALEASDFPLLRYRFADFPRTLELSLVFRTADDPEDVRTIALPWPGNATGTFNLRDLPSWRGRIVELGFAQFPTAQLVPAARGFKPFEIVDAALWSPSWQGDLAALATDWFGAWPWSLRSVNALGRDTDTPRAQTLIVCVALVAAVALFWWAVLFGWRDRRIVPAAVAIAAVAWLIVDMSWQAGLWGRLQTTRAVYADLSWAERQRTVADTDIVDAAEKLRAMLRDEPQQARILVHAGSGYELLRFIWHMLPRNVATFAYASAYGQSLPDGCLIVFFDTDDWRTQDYWRRLLAHSEHLATAGSIHSDNFDDARLVVFRFRRGH